MMRAAGVYVKDVENQDKWRFRAKVADLKQLGGRRRTRRKRNFGILMFFYFKFWEISIGLKCVKFVYIENNIYTLDFKIY